MDFAEHRSRLESAGVLFEPGLTRDEVQEIEALYRISFPPDYRDLLRSALPISNGFVDWRHTSETNLRSMLEGPRKCISHRVAYNAFWLREWGPRPHRLQQQFEVVGGVMDQAPMLIPVAARPSLSAAVSSRAHLTEIFIPSVPAEAGNPILWITEKHVRYYGQTLGEYLEKAAQVYFAGEEYENRVSQPVKHIPFWSYLVDLDQGLA